MTHGNDAIAVIGGGFTGLVAALRLSGAGYAVELFERGQTLGGLASGVRMHGTSIERTYHHLFRGDADIIGLARELGISDRLLWHRSSMAIYYDGRIWPFMTPGDLLRFKPISIVDRVRVGLAVLYLQRQPSSRRFRGQPALAWMRDRAGERGFSVIWEPMLRGKFGRFADIVSMEWLWARLHVRANSRVPEDSVERLGYFEGGFNTIVSAIQDRLNADKVQIHTDSAVEAVSGGVSPTVTIDGKVRHFAAVIATVPSHVFAKLTNEDVHLSSAYRRQLESVQYLGAICLVFSSSQDLGGTYWVSVNEPDAPFLVFINHTRLIGRSFYDGNCVYYAATYLPHDHALFSQATRDVEAQWFAYISKMYPGFDREKVKECHLTRFQNAQHVVDCDYERRIPSFTTPTPNVYLANFSQIFPEDRGTNYAVRDGTRVASLVDAALKSRSRPRHTQDP
ncbi:MAG TPA: NAD(P)/FAD-dependent oxidoreductase [Gemmatimonadaceae bacterium]|nr:NAD(P)/FAD-dependent oxidoreductase [Gemmatimonadaceae bacterium]